MTMSSLRNLAEQAQAALRRGDAGLAFKLARQAVAQQSRHPGLNHLAGIAAHHAGDSATALRYLRKAVELQAGFPGVLTDLGQVAWLAGRADEALKAFRQATRLHAGDADSWEGLGNVLLALNHLDEAVEALQRAAGLAPGNPRVMSNLGAALARSGRYDAAREVLQDAVARSGGMPDALANLAMLEAEAGNQESARDWARQALDRVPGHVMALIALAKAEQRAGDLSKAESLARQAAAAAPGNAEILLSLASVLSDLGRASESETYYKRVLDLAPDHPRALTGLAALWVVQGRYAAARDLLQKAIGIEPDRVGPRMEMALLELSQGNFAAAFPHFSWRFRAENQRSPRPFTQPFWDGGPEPGRQILLWGEQGVGDEVLWLSLLPNLLDAGVRVTLECDRRLLPLIRRSFPQGVSAHGLADPPAAACQAPDLQQLPLGELFRFVPPSAAPYLTADSQRVRELRARLDGLSGGRPLVGVSWRSAAPSHGVHKSFAVENLAALRGGDWALVSLQYGDVAADLERAKAVGCDILALPDLDITNDLDGFAALVAAMDMVATVSNTTVHFAGGLGVPTEVMLSKARGRLWYYGVTGSECRWYPEVRLRRQAEQGQWDDVLAAVRAVLEQRFGG